MQTFTQKIAGAFRQMRNEGFLRFIKSKVYDYGIRAQLKKMGVGFYTSMDGHVEHSINNDAHENHPSSFYSIKEGLAVIPFEHGAISMTDIGCGNGPALQYGILLRFKKVCGIDLDKNAVAAAIENCNKLKQFGYTTSFAVEQGDATKYAIPDDVNIIYLFNPFGGTTMQAVAENIFAHATKQQRTIYVLYCMPAFQQYFEKVSQCKKLYTRYNTDNSHAQISVFEVKP
jgi:predicted RNA methylase